MYLKKIKIVNYGPIIDIDYELPFNENSSPKPVILVGQNGSGKTLFLTNIIHSLIEMKRNAFDEIPETSKNKYFRVATKSYISNYKDYYLIGLGFLDDYYYIDIATNKLDDFSYLEIFEHVDINDNRLKELGFYENTKYFTKKTFEENIFLYFPVDRYYEALWQNTDNIKFHTKSRNIVGISETNMVKYNILKELEGWIIDVILDKCIYEIQNTIVVPGNYEEVQTIKPQYKGKNYDLQNQINKILTLILKNNHDIEYARLGVSQKHYRKISIMVKYNNEGGEKQLVSELSALSSGEIMCLAIFASILKEFDVLLQKPDSQIQEVNGIVLIDEIDISLHHDFVKDVMPSLIELFPKIQFIVSSHSPFFLLGMEEKFKEKCEFLHFPSGIVMEDIKGFSEIRKCYDVLDKNYNEVVSVIEKLRESLDNLTMPFIITEGKTDWKHTKNAYNALRVEYKYSEIAFCEYEDGDMGDSTLKTILKHYARTLQKQKIIGIFDSDKKPWNDTDKPFDYGNNVFGICIPDFHNYGCGVSIEMLYNRQDMTKENSSKHRLFLSDEFNAEYKHKEKMSMVCKLKKIINDYYTSGIIKVIHDKVYDISDGRSTSLAMSKNEFAESVLNNVPPFNNMNLEGFKELLDKIMAIINNEENEFANN